MHEACLILPSGRKGLLYPLAPLQCGPVFCVHMEELMGMTLRKRLGAVALQVRYPKRLSIGVRKLPIPTPLNTISYLDLFFYMFV